MQIFTTDHTKWITIRQSRTSGIDSDLSGLTTAKNSRTLRTLASASTFFCGVFGAKLQQNCSINCPKYPCYAGHVHSRRHKASLWCMSVRLSIHPSVPLSVPSFFLTLTRMFQVIQQEGASGQTRPAHVLDLLSKDQYTCFIKQSQKGTKTR